ncbi:MAG: hypothetical protein VX278_15270 [Myxococcota bacterium]|nr:hypothetical protein [Myxococcota bacterium]
MIQKSDLEGWIDFPTLESKVENVILSSLQEPESLLRFLFCYVSWNGYFGSGVATLSGKIGRSQSVFIDPDESFLPAADRAVLIASYVFDAARDEFDDSSTIWRDTHRCLAQALLKGCHQFFSKKTSLDSSTLYRSPFWLNGLNSRVAQGYGAGSSDDALHIFRALGYHVGSELLADKEFSIIDATLSKRYPKLVEFLSEERFVVGDAEHSGYAWFSIHSGHGGGVEADHFSYAMRSVELAFQFIDAPLKEEMRHHFSEGFQLFARDHSDFFNQVHGEQI